MQFTVSQLRLALTSAARMGNAIAAWRLPGEERITALVDLHAHQNIVSLTQCPYLSGFAVAPFCRQGGDVRLLKPDILFDSISRQWSIHPWADREKADCFLHALESPFNNRTPEKQLWHIHPHRQANHSSKEDDYIRWVSEALDSIKKGDFDKVVLARRKEVPLSKGMHPVDLFASCLNLYPWGMVSLVSAPGLGAWVGATPERLISRKSTGEIRTMALAATKPAPKSKQALNEVCWSDKERQEQAFVAKFIRDCHTRIGLDDFLEAGPKTVAAYDVAHLQTEFVIENKHGASAASPFLLLEQLHPTSAVCGMDKEAARAFILANENFPRQLYSGYLGPVNLGGEIHLFVNLRCAQFFQNSAVLYAGAGVILGSEPKKEWRETEMKMCALNHLLR